MFKKLKDKIASWFQSSEIQKLQWKNHVKDSELTEKKKEIEDNKTKYEAEITQLKETLSETREELTSAQEAIRYHCEHDMEQDREIQALNRKLTEAEKKEAAYKLEIKDMKYKCGQLAKQQKKTAKTTTKTTTAKETGKKWDSRK